MAEEKGWWVGNQRSAGILPKFEATPENRAAALLDLRQKRISAIVCCCGDDPTVFEPFAVDGISYCSAFLSDGHDPQKLASSEAQLPAFLARIRPIASRAHAQGDSVLVHCNAGAHRSVSVLCALLMEERVCGLVDVFADVVRIRAIAEPIYWPWLLESHEPQILAQRQSSSSRQPVRKSPA
eukprot:TRINITY_DN3425_c0_g1_i3.p1 TRINITY_DN3425_c0_g1~~TRINITY_DN3425_c0_g1_i3.p1  ORF type:complete len:207 (-),score=34.11 TRINITY_DN3425_c0_g1_i3:79-624(-)